MKKNSNARLLPLLIAPAILPAILLPVMLGHDVPDGLIGATMGFFIGLALVALVFMTRRNSRCAPPGL